MQLIVVSAKKEASLREYLKRLHAFLSDGAGGASLDEIAYTLQVGRKALDERWATVSTSLSQLIDTLAEWSRDAPTSVQVYRGKAAPAAAPAIVDHNDLPALARQWVAGGTVDWENLPRRTAVRRVGLPTYAFEKKRYWMTDVVTAYSDSPDETAGPTTIAGNAAGEYYDQTALVDDSRFEEQYLSLAPFAEVQAGFSWTRAMFEGEQCSAKDTLLRQQRDLRNVLLRDTDWGRVQNIFDLGCGLGTDLIRIAREHPQVRGAGYTISARQAQVAQRRIQSENLGDRLQVYHRDSSREPIPPDCDLILGIEVVHHVPDKEGLFGNIRLALRANGSLVLADCVSATVSVNDPATGSYTLNQEQYGSLFARHQLRITSCIDASQEIANFLHDPDLEAVLAGANGRTPEAGQTDLVARTHRAWNHFGMALRQQTIRYLLITASPAASVPLPDLIHINRDMLANPLPYPGSQPVVRAAQPMPNQATVRNDVRGGTEFSRRLRARLADILQSTPEEIDTNARFAELGLDSLTGLKFLDGINREWGLTLGAEVLYDHSSIADLAAYLGTRSVGEALLQLDVAPRPVAVRPPSAPMSAASTDIAVVGLSVRFPGAANATQFWKNLAEGRDCIGEVPVQRWSIEQHYAAIPAAATSLPASGADSSTTTTASTRCSSTSRRAKRNTWIRNSGCFSKNAGTRWRTQVTPSAGWPSRVAACMRG